MQSQSPYTELTFYYLDGRNESFTVYETADSASPLQGFQMQVRHILKKDWWILHLPEQTVLINIENVVKVEVKPAMPQLQGEDVFVDADRITALSRGR